MSSSGPTVTTTITASAALHAHALLVQARSETRARAARVVHSAHGVESLLAAALEVVRPDIEWNLTKHKHAIVREVLAVHVRSGVAGTEYVLNAFADVADQHPADAPDLAVVLLAPITVWPTALILSRAAGRFTPQVFHDAFYPHIAYAVFLRRNIERRGSGLSASQRALGRVLVPNWEGSLNSLLETLRTLHDD